MECEWRSSFLLVHQWHRRHCNFWHIFVGTALGKHWLLCWFSSGSFQWSGNIPRGSSFENCSQQVSKGRWTLFTYRWTHGRGALGALHFATFQALRRKWQRQFGEPDWIDILQIHNYFLVPTIWSIRCKVWVWSNICIYVCDNTCTICFFICMIYSLE